MPDPVDELYMLPVRDFTAARDRLAAKLAADDERDRAREVKALRRPTVAAWVVNQLAHRHRAALRRLIDAGEVLRKAQRRLVRGGNAGELRAAAKQRQEVLRELRRLAQGILREAGAAPHLDDILATLEAASIDPAAARAVTAGRLARELPRPSGFGESPQLTLIAAPGRTPPTPSAPRSKQPRAAEVARNRRRARALVDDAKRLEREAARSEQAVARTAQRAATLERARRDQERRVHGLREELGAAERRLREVDAELARARTEAARASERAGELRRDADAARARAETEA
jgi:hypothetical protein